MRGILIDPAAKTVTSVEHNGDHKDILRLIGDPPDGLDCRGLSEKVAMYCDDLGVYREGQHYFTLAGYPDLLPGKVLLLGIDDRGESVSVHLKPETVRANTRFFSLQPVFRGITDAQEPAMIYGRPGTRIIRTAHYDPEGVKEE